MLSHARLFVTTWTTAHQASLSRGFSRQEYWNGLPFPTPTLVGAYLNILVLVFLFLVVGNVSNVVSAAVAAYLFTKVEKILYFLHEKLNLGSIHFSLHPF